MATQEMSREALQKLYKRVLVVVSISQMFGGAGLAAGISVGALLVQQMTGDSSISGVPTALFTLGSAVTAYTVGKISQKYGRRIGLSAGFFVGGIGALGVIFAAILNNLILLFIALFVYGAGTATNLQARYAGTDLATKEQRAKAISTTMVMTTFGAVAGPNLISTMGNVAESLHMPALAGPFILSMFAYLLAGLTLFLMLRPDPLQIAKQLEQNQSSSQAMVMDSSQAQRKDGIIVGATVMILTQVVMVAIMTMTPIHMTHHGHNLTSIGLVIGFHVGFMYFPSLITGVLVDKFGRTVMIIGAAITLVSAGLLAAYAPTDSLLLLIIALALLGLGWNFGLISGTALIVDHTTIAERAKVQGTIDVFIAISGAAAGLLSGLIVAKTSYGLLSISGALISLTLLLLVGWIMKRR
ncbi:MFS transporter [Solibacillus sp. FSL R7-0668]|uniref:MFS transporter n=1 Tax=Solibacillus sp. FSL R7-0668 TaxID=2921688 RepID=UPI0030FB57AA